MAEHSILAIKNASYMAQYNTVETAIGFLKAAVKKERLAAIMKDEQRDLRKMVLDAGQKISKELCVKLVKRSLNELN